MHFGRAGVIGVAALLAARRSCLAQDATPDRSTTKREKVFVTLVDAEDELHGGLLRLDSQSLSIEVEKRRVDLPLHRVLKIEKKVHDTVLDGAVLLGLFVAACAKWWCAQGASGGPNLPQVSSSDLVSAHWSARGSTRSSIGGRRSSPRVRHRGASRCARLSFSGCVSEADARRRRVRSYLSASPPSSSTGLKRCLKNLSGELRIAGEEEVLRLTIAHFLNGISIEVEEDRTRVAQDDGRVSGDEELRMARGREVMNDLEERGLALRRQCRFRFIQEVDSLLEAIGEESHEGFAVGLLVQRFAAVQFQV